MATVPVASVAVLVRPVAQGFKAELNKQLNTAGLAATGREISEEITEPLKKDAKKAGKDAHESISKEVGKPVKQKLSLGNRFKAAGKKAGQEFKKNFQSMIKGGLLLAGTAIGAGGFMFLKDATAEASNLEQSVGGLEAVFKDSSGVMKEFSENAANELGLSKNEYNQLATLMGTQLKAGGLDGSELTAGVQEMMVLGSDLGSLYGTTTEEATAAISSAFRGEYEPLRAYGITLSETAIEAEALEMGLIKEGEAMDAAAKQAATQSLIMEQSADAQGNFGRESDTLANKQQKAAAQFANVKASVGEMLLPALTGLMDVVTEKVLPGFESLVGWVKDELVPALASFGEWVQKNSAWLAPLGIALGIVAGAVTILVAGMAIWAGVTALVAGAQSALNLALLANPITWIVIGIIALVAALIYAYKNSETFRNIVNGVWASIKSAIGAVVNWIVTYVWPVIKAAWDGIAAGAIWLYHNAILPAWNGIKFAIGAVAGWIMNTLVPWLQMAWTAISNAALWLWRNVMQPVWTGIKTAIAIAVTAVLVYIDLLKWYFNNVIAPVAMWLWQNVMQPVWNGIKAAIGAVVTWFKDVAWPLLSTVINWIRTKFEQFKLGLQIIWNFIKNNVINPVVNWFRGTVWPILSLVIDWLKKKFENFKTNLGIIWNFIKNNVINPVVNWFRGTVWPVFSSVINWLRTKFDQFKTGLGIIWNFIKNNIIAPVMNWFRNVLLPIFRSALDSLKSAFNVAKTVIQNVWTAMKDRLKSVYDNNIKPMIDRFKGAIQGLKDTFNNVKDGITEAWNKIRDAGKKPVKFVVQDIIRDGVVKKFNTVASTFGIGTIDEKKFTVGWARGGILPGFTPMAKGDDVLTPMRSGEGVLVSEGLRDSRSRSAFLAANAAAKRGTSFADFLGAGYAEGGIVKLRMPFDGSYPRGDGFGARGGRHKGIDWPMPPGALLKAVAGGVVSRTWNPAAGNKLELSLGNGLVATYHHLSSYIAKAGAQVAAGANVAKVGNTGRSSGPHLHFGIKKDGKYVDPLPYLGGGGAAGSGDGGWFTNPFSGLWDSLKTKIREGVGNTPFGDALFNMPKKLIDGGLNFISDKIAALGDWATETVDDAAGAARWTPVATEALVREGQFGPKRLASLLRRMGQESSYNPRAINTWDSNAAAGNSSRGLMQVIPTTFAAYRDKSLPNDIYDPLANVVASIRYTLARYGDLEKGWDRKGGYAQGGIVKPYLHDNGGYLQPGLSVIENRTRKPEYILNEKQWQAVYEGRDQAGRGITLNQYINSTNATADAVASGVTWELRRKGITGR